MKSTKSGLVESAQWKVMICTKLQSRSLKCGRRSYKTSYLDSWWTTVSAWPPPAPGRQGQCQTSPWQQSETFWLLSFHSRTRCRRLEAVSIEKWSLRRKRWLEGWRLHPTQAEQYLTNLQLSQQEMRAFNDINDLKKDPEELFSAASLWECRETLSKRKWFQPIFAPPATMHDNERKISDANGFFLDRKLPLSMAQSSNNTCGQFLQSNCFVVET